MASAWNLAKLATGFAFESESLIILCERALCRFGEKPIGIILR